MVANPKQKFEQSAPYEHSAAPPHALHWLAFPLQDGAIHPAEQSLPIKQVSSHATKHELEHRPWQLLQESYVDAVYKKIISWGIILHLSIKHYLKKFFGVSLWWPCL